MYVNMLLVQVTMACRFAITRLVEPQRSTPIVQTRCATCNCVGITDSYSNFY